MKKTNLNLTRMAAPINMEEVWRIVHNGVIDRAAIGDLNTANIELLTFLNSRANTSAANGRFNTTGLTMGGADGKVRTLHASFIPKKYHGDTTATAMEYCPTGGTTTPMRHFQKTIEFSHVSDKIALTDDFFRNIQEGREQVAIQYMTNEMVAFLEGLNDKMAALIADPANGYIGNAIGENTVRSVPFFTSTNEVNESGPLWLAAKKRLHKVPNFVLIGGERLAAYGEKKGWTGMNSKGVTADAMSITNTAIYDARVTTTLNDKLGLTSGVLAVAPGAIMPFYYCKHKGDFAYSDSRQVRRTMLVPNQGFEIDVLGSVEVCGDEVVRYYQFAVYFTLLGYPKCFDENPLYAGVTDVFPFNIACGPEGVCDVINEIALQPSQPLNNYTPTPAVTHLECGVTANCNAAFTVQRFVNGSIFYGYNPANTSDYVTDVTVTTTLPQGTITANLVTASMPNGYLVGSAIELALATKAINDALVAAGVTTIEFLGLSFNGINLEAFAVEQSNWQITTIDVVFTGNGMGMGASGSDIYLVTSAATPSAGATLTDINYANGSFSVNGAPDTLINFANKPKGKVNRFYIAKADVSGDITQTITDSTACTDTVTVTP